MKKGHRPHYITLHPRRLLPPHPQDSPKVAAHCLKSFCGSKKNWILGEIYKIYSYLCSRTKALHNYMLQNDKFL